MSTPVARQIIIAGGGTGGHIFPAIAIANAIKAEAPATNILFVGAKGKMEMEKVPQAGYEIEGLNIAGFNRSSLIKNIFLPFKLLKSFFQVRSIFNRFKPDAAIGVGGYSSFPVLKYAQNKGIPTFIHESNSFAGKSNKMLGKKATRIFTATPGMEKFFPAEKIQVTGNPVRQVIERMNISRDEAIHFFKLNPLKKTVLSLGGSLGAQAINEAIARHLDAFEKNDLQLIWQTGKSFKEKATEMADGYKNIYVSDFIMQMEYAYTAADIVISRSGAMALAELCLAKKPVVFVPYPFAAEDHQTANAKTLVDKSAALLVANHDAMEKLVPAVIALSKDEAKQQAMKAKIGNEARRHADVEIAKSVLSYINKN
ncbi:MAG: undecaprenyldiphospho-muramoylpentapeptide beta-N-acetylglucosaminyltransferase [Niastella sp. SCN 39-18]|nr:MAG: undecaprenyldiphospho-muramoylpentapeptide beta-N-acetylglucosaminyltransferase [Niastella sp. SCN 39-18]OJW10831.1 MAG: undecaprenyldiphospho-muramoylpentapeptide beta-N-acetylglucosaminyltransferase [Sphingobacteriales bacterium 39-19]